MVPVPIKSKKKKGCWEKKESCDSCKANNMKYHQDPTRDIVWGGEFF